MIGNVAHKAKHLEKVKKERPLSDIRKNWQLYIMLLVPVIYILIFKYGPMYGTTIAFTNYVPIKGYFGSEWVGFDNFIRFFKSPQCITLIKNRDRLKFCVKVNRSHPFRQVLDI